jgi:hypothetical protein
VAKICVEFALNVSVSPLSFAKITLFPVVRPETATLIVGLLEDVEHVAVTVIFDVIVPVALLLSVQVCPVGCVFTLTE